MTEQERREHFAFLNGVATDMKESRKGMESLIIALTAAQRWLSHRKVRKYDVTK